MSDILARLLAQRLSERFNQTFVVENRPGAASNVAASTVIHSAPDGYTLLLAGISNAINVSLYQKLDFDFVHDVTPISLISRSPLVMVVNPGFPARTVPDFIAYAKTRPAKLNMGSPGTGGASHVGGELFQMLAGIKMVHVAYRGSPPALSDLMAGRIDVMFDNIASSISLIQSGKLRGLAVSSRASALPDTPLISRFLSGYEAYVWNGIVAPKNCPPKIVAKLNAEIKGVVDDPVYKAQLTKLGNTPAFDTPDEFAKLIAADSHKWAKVIDYAGIRPE
ncbi:MAG TPA: tripartite tricarboxylate transporter substrate binding protein [Stellaceae bacterium]|nr:tripartite tricarboxylate transporter substrate binding protein [Stellaceae bacterium]